MNKVILRYSGIALVLALSTNVALAQEGFGTNTPDKSAVIDIVSNKRGLLIPRVDLTSTIIDAPVSAPAQSLLVYNKNTTKSGGTTDVTPGYYYWDTNRWVRFAQQEDITDITLDGDVTGATGANTVVKIQGVAIDATTPLANQVLTFVNGKWTATNTTNVLDLSGNLLKSTVNGVDSTVELTEVNLVSSKSITGTGITVNGGAGATLTDVKLELTPGTNGQVMVTNNNLATWVDQSTIVPTTTNEITSTGNTMTSVVNNFSSDASIVNTLETTIAGTVLKTDVNGISDTIDLAAAIQLGQRKTEVLGINGVSVTPAVGTVDNTDSYTVSATLSGDVTGVANATKVEGLQGKPVSPTAPVNGQALVFDGTNWTPMTPTVTDAKDLTAADVNLGPDDIDESTIQIVTGGIGSVLTETSLRVRDKSITTKQMATTDKNSVLSSDENGAPVWKKEAPRFFYMPAVIFDTKVTGQNLTRNLYQDYVNQFTGGTGGSYDIAHGASGYTKNYTGGIVGSSGAPSAVPYYAANELCFYVTYYDTDVFANLTIDANGVLTYDITGISRPGSYMNIVFVVK